MAQFEWYIDGVKLLVPPVNWQSFLPRISRDKRYRTVSSVLSANENQIRFVKDGKNAVDALYTASGANATGVFLIKKKSQAGYTFNAYLTLALDFDTYQCGDTETSVGIQVNDLTRKWKSRDELDIDLLSLVDQDGNAITTFGGDELLEIDLTGQILDKKLRGENSATALYTLDASDIYGVIGFTRDEMVWDEIPGRFNYPVLGVTAILPGELVILEEDGDIDFDLFLTCEENIGGGGTDFANVECYLVKNNETPIALTKTVIPGAFNQATYEYTGTDSFVKGDELRLYFENTGAGTESFNWLPNDSGLSLVSYVDLVHHTTFPDTTCKGMLVWEYFLRMAQSILGKNDALRSAYYGRTDGEVHDYDADGAGSLRFVTVGELVRGYPVASGRFISSLYQGFQVFNGMDNIGMAIRTIDGEERLVIEPIEYFNGSTLLFTAIGVKGSVRRPALALHYNEILTGSTRWEIEQYGTRQTVHAGRVHNVNTVVKNTYNAKVPAVISGPLAEILRRDAYKNGEEKDNRYDSDLVVVSVVRDGGGYRPKVGTDIEAVTGLTNSAEAYNLDMTPAAFLKAHAKSFKGGLKRVPACAITFVSGEANYTATTQQGIGDPVVAEDDSYELADLDDALHWDDLLEATFPLSRGWLEDIYANPDALVKWTDAAGTVFHGRIEDVSVTDLQTNEAKVVVIEVEEV